MNWNQIYHQQLRMVPRNLLDVERLPASRVAHLLVDQNLIDLVLVINLGMMGYMLLFVTWKGVITCNIMTEVYAAFVHEKTQEDHATATTLISRLFTEEFNKREPITSE